MRPAVPPPIVEEEPPQRILGGDRLYEFDIPQSYEPTHLKEKYLTGWDKINDSTGLPIAGHGVDRWKQPYQRYLDYGPGAKELMYLAGGLRKDFRRIPGTQSLRGAHEWIDRTGKKNWAAFEEDITGPEMKPDGIKEVVVTDAKGNVKVVNGYALKNSDYPWRKQYYETYKTKEKQRENPFAVFKRRGMMPAMQPGDLETGYGYSLPMPEGVRPKAGARAVYRKQIFAPSYAIFKEYTKALPWSPMDKARLSSDIFKVCYETIIVKTAIANKVGIKIDRMQQLDEKQYKKLMHKDEQKRAVIDELNSYLANEGAGVPILLLKTVWLIVKSLENLADIDIPRNITVYGVKLETLMSFKNVHEIEEQLTEEMMSPVIGGWQTQQKAMTDEIMTAYNQKLTESDKKRAATKEAHDKFMGTRFAKGTALGRRDAMFGDYYGLDRNDRYGQYYRHQGYAPLDVPAPVIAPEPSQEEILAAKIDKFYEISELERENDLTEQLEQFIKEEIPNREINYYGSPGFLNEFIKWRKATVKVIFNDVIQDEDIKIKPKQVESYFTKVDTYYDVNMDSKINRDDVKALVKYILQERPTLRDIRTSSFRVKFLTDQAEKLISNGG